MKKLYFLTLAISGVLSLCAIIPGLPLVLTLMTLGIGMFALTAAMNLFVILLCLLPVVLCGVRRFAGYPLAAALLAVAFALPGHMTQRVMAPIVASHQQDDMQQPGALAEISGAGLELIGPPAGGLGDARAFLGGEECGDLCKRFLHGGQFDWVRVVSEQRGSHSRRSVLARRGDADNCAAARCFVYVKDDGARPDVTVRISEEYLEPQSFPREVTTWARPMQLARVTVYKGSAMTGTLVWQQTQVRYEGIPQPNIFFPIIADMKDSLLPVLWATTRHNALNAKAIAADLGLALLLPQMKGFSNPNNFKPRHAPRKTPEPAAGEADMVASLIESDMALSRELQFKILNWTRKLVDAKKLDPRDVALLMLIAQDERIEIPTSLDTIFKRNAQLQEALLPWVFDEMERGDDEKRMVVRKIARAIAWSTIPTADLAPYEPRFRALIEDGGYGDDLITSAGRFGTDPTNVLIRYASDHVNPAEGVVGAICRSDPQWYATLEPLARRYAEQGLSKRPQRLKKGPTLDALKFLARTGHRAEVAQMIRASSIQNKDSFLITGFAGPLDRDNHPWGPCRR